MKHLVKIWRMLTFPIAYLFYFGSSVGYYRLSHAWRWYVIPEGRLLLSDDEYWALRADMGIPSGRAYQRANWNRTFGCYYCFVSLDSIDYDRVLLFKSEAEKNWFILKYR